MPANRKKLNDKQAAFAREYVIDLDATKAAIRAGYSPRSAGSQGHDLLAHPDVAAEIQRLNAIKAKRASIAADEIVEGLASIFRSDIRDALEWGMTEVVDDEGLPVTLPDGSPLMNPEVRAIESHLLPKHVSFAVKKVSKTDKGTFTVEMHDKMAAADKLMRHLGMFEADNKQVVDGLAMLIQAAQGTTLPIATRRRPQQPEGGDE